MKIYLTDTEPLKATDRFEKMLLKMPECRKKKVLRMSADHSRRQSLGAGILLSIALSERGLTEEETKTGPHGKPYLPGEDRFFFNLSHSGSRVMCAVAEEPVGCDVQQITDIREYQRIASRFFAQDEVLSMERIADDQERKELFFRYWALKESYIKATGEGFSMPMNQFSICFPEDGSPVLRGNSQANVSLFELRMNDGYCYACCLLKGAVSGRPDIQWIDLSENR